MTKLTDFLEVPKYKLTLPISKREVNYRPFLVKEQRILLQAQEEKDEKLIVNTILNVIEVCTFNELEINTLNITDFEYLFLNIRAKSAGTNINVTANCQHCKAQNDISLSIDEVKIQESDKVIENPIKINDSLYITMQYPTANIILNAETNSIKIIKECIKSFIYGDSVYNVDSRTPDEIMEFLDMLSSEQLEKLKNFIESLPTLYLPAKFNCVNCKKDNEIKFESLIELFI